MKKIFVLAVILSVVAIFQPANGHALMLMNGVSENGIGAYTGSFDYSYVDSTSGEIVISLTNTTPIADGGYITALAFNNPTNLITGVSLSATDTDFSIIGAPFTTNGIAAGPFGNFDIGASTSGSFQGGGSPALGIGVGDSATFTFSLTGTGLDALTAESFFSAAALSSPPADGQGVQNFVVRYRGFENGGSDKVVGDPHSAPEPASMVLFGTGLVGAALRRKFAV